MTDNKITRRQALEIILATGGGLGLAAFMPSKWIKPIVVSGVIPVHARTSIYGSYTLIASADRTSGEPIFDSGSGIYTISAIKATITSIGGLPLNNIPVTLSLKILQNGSGGTSADFFGASSLPETVNTDGSGIANFSDLNIHSCFVIYDYELDFVAIKSPYTISSVKLGAYELKQTPIC